MALGFPSPLPLSGRCAWLGFLLCFVIVLIPLTGSFGVCVVFFSINPFCSVTQNMMPPVAGREQSSRSLQLARFPHKEFCHAGEVRRSSLGMPQASRGCHEEGFPHDRKPERRQQGQRGLPRGTSSYKELAGDERWQLSRLSATRSWIPELQRPALKSTGQIASTHCTSWGHTRQQAPEERTWGLPQGDAAWCHVRSTPLPYPQLLFLFLSTLLGLEGGCFPP